MLLLDRIAQRQVEPWRVVWRGPKAQQWWQQHQDGLKPGTALQVQAQAARSYICGRSGSEIVADLIDCVILPPANHIQKDEILK